MKAIRVAIVMLGLCFIRLDSLLARYKERDQIILYNIEIEEDGVARDQIDITIRQHKGAMN